jgi:hypothetical protein
MFRMKGGEVGGPAFTGAVGVVDCIEGGGDIRKWCGLPTEYRLDGCPDAEAFRSTELGWAAVGGGQDALGLAYRSRRRFGRGL